MKCDKTESILLDYLYNELNENERQNYEKHLETCADCSSELEEMRLTSKAMGTWEVPEQKINMVFVAEKHSLIDRVKEMLPSFEVFTRRPVMSFMYGAAALFLMLSVANFEVAYDSENGSFSMAASMFGQEKSEEPEMNYELVNRQLMETQSQMIELVNQMITERESRQREITYNMVGEVVQELSRDWENRRDEDMRTLGMTLIKLSDMADQNNQYINTTRSMLVDLATNAGIELKR